MKSRNERLSEHLLQTDDAILNTAYEIDDPEKLKAYKKTKSAPITLLPRSAVWVPIVAAAACVALTVGLWQGGVFSSEKLPVEAPNESATTEVTDPTDTEKPATSVTGGTDKTDPTKNTTTGKDKPTTKPTTKTEPPKTTGKTDPTTQTTTGKNTIVITGNDSSEWTSESYLNLNDEYISFALKEKMRLYAGQDVKYAVIVEIAALIVQDSTLFWQSTVELAQFNKEYYEVINTFDQEALRLNPSYTGNPKDIKIWTEEMRELYERIPELIKQRRIYEKQYYDSYLTNSLNQRVKDLKAIVGTELIPISVNPKYYPFVAKSSDYAFFMELTAEEINAIAEYSGCYLIRLTTRDWYGSGWD